MSELPSVLRDLYSRLPLSLRHRLRGVKRPLFSAFGSALWNSDGGRTISGPFRGLRHVRRVFRPILIGTYESELHAWVEQLCSEPFTHVVNVGGGGGYYAVGFALRLIHARVTVFELVPRAAAVIAQTAALNGVADRVSVRGECTIAALGEALGDGRGTLVVMDVEGAELELLDPLRLPALLRAVSLVETHDVLVAGCAATIRQRFGSTHRIEECESADRTIADYPSDLLPTLRSLMPRAALESIDEIRGGAQTWLLLRPLRVS